MRSIVFVISNKADEETTLWSINKIFVVVLAREWGWDLNCSNYYRPLLPKKYVEIVSNSNHLKKLDWFLAQRTCVT